MTDIDDCAEFLLGLRESHEVVDNIPQGIYPATEETAYRIQDRVVHRLTEKHGSATCGYKLACTNSEIMAHLGVAGPLSGRLMTHSMYEDGVSLKSDDFLLRIVELEFVFVLGSDVPASNDDYSEKTIMPFITVFHPGIEIVDHRFADFTRVGGNALISDNAIHGCSVLGQAGESDWRDVDLVNHPVNLLVNNEVRCRGSGKNVLGSPLIAMAWLANHLQSRGSRLMAGDIVTTGTACDVYYAETGDEITADFDKLGAVSLTFN